MYTTEEVEQLLQKQVTKTAEDLANKTLGFQLNEYLELDLIEIPKVKQYIALTEVTPIQIKPEVLTLEQVEKVFKTFKQYGNYPQEIKKELLPNYQIIKLSQETFNFICNSAIVEQERFGEKTYRLNNQTFKIYEWDDYVNQFGEPDFGEKN